MAREMTPQATRSDIDSFKIFYNVKTDEELIAAMHYHIEKLQGKLSQVQPSGPAVRQVQHDPTGAGGSSQACCVYVWCPRV